tara:strand:+ start:86 stop:340 length:255 start_codon:yes stop_codon:yes gene_type:complete
MNKRITQYDAQMVADWFNGSNKVHLGVVQNEELKDLFDKSEKLRLKAHQIILKDNNWLFEINNKKKKEREIIVKYNHFKGENNE